MKPLIISIHLYEAKLPCSKDILFNAISRFLHHRPLGDIYTGMEEELKESLFNEKERIFFEPFYPEYTDAHLYRADMNELHALTNVLREYHLKLFRSILDQLDQVRSDINGAFSHYTLRPLRFTEKAILIAVDKNIGTLL